MVAEKVSNQWRTDPVFLAACEKRFGRIVYDLASSGKVNAVAPYYRTRKHDHLTWKETAPPGNETGAAFLNHEYSGQYGWYQRIRLEFEERGFDRTLLNLGKCDTSTRYFRGMTELACMGFFLPRLKFLDHEGKPRQSADFASVLFVVVPGLTSIPCHFEWWDFRTAI